MIDGFDRFPDELRDVNEIDVECVDSEYNPEACGEWSETYPLASPGAVMMDNRGYIHFDGPPTECPECGNYVALRYNGVEIVTEP